MAISQAAIISVKYVCFVKIQVKSFKSVEWAAMMMCHYEKPKNANQNVVMNRPCIAPFLTSLAPIDGPESQLSIGANLVKNGAIQGHFVAVF